MVRVLVPFLRSRVPALVSVLAIALLLGFGTHARGSLAAAWELLRIPSTTPHFADTRFIASAIECAEAGQNPYVVCTHDPWLRVYNYPPVWLELGYLGFNSRSSDMVGIIFAMFTITAMVTLFSSRGWVGGFVAFAAMWSWPLLFGVERGNIDTLIFSVSVLMLLGMHRLSARHEQLGRELLVVGLAILKLYPIAMSLLFIRGSKGWWRAGLVFVASALAVFATCFHRLHQVFVNTPTDYWLSFGSFDTLVSAQPYLPPVFRGHLGHGGRTVAMLGAALVGAMTMAYGSTSPALVKRFLPRFDANSGIGAVASMGLAIFYLTFVLSSNYDYRLIFLLGPLGFLVRDLSTSNTLRSLPMSLLLLAEQFSLYSGRTGIAHVLHPLVFLVACTWLGHGMLALDTPAPRAETQPKFSQREELLRGGLAG